MLLPLSLTQEAVSELLRGASDEDLVLYLLSGGGSAICESPSFADISLEGCRDFYRALVTGGDNIVDVNHVRKMFSALKGGRMTVLAGRARQLTLYVSDAPPGYPSNVALGPTMGDEAGPERCREILSRPGLAKRLPASIRRRVERGELPPTPKPGDAIFEHSSWHCLLSPDDATSALSGLCRRAGWDVAIDSSTDDSCPRNLAVERLLSRLNRMIATRKDDRRCAVVAGGEYSCPAPGDGLGGRNQAFVLECLPRISGRQVTVLSAGTDGIDRVSRAAGAVADASLTREHRRRAQGHRSHSQISRSVRTRYAQIGMKSLHLRLSITLVSHTRSIGSPSELRDPLVESEILRMSPKRRVSAVSYLNTSPLVWGMLHGPQHGVFDVSFTLPSECADALRAGEADIGLIPIIELARQPELVVVPGSSIACEGAVRSILLVSKKPLDEVRSFAADSGSRTSVVLAQIILARKHRVRPNVVALPADLDHMLEQADAALIIGDPALKIDPGMESWRGQPVHVYDLGAEWFEMTALPMVFAVWAGKGLDSSVIQVLADSASYGRARTDEIVEHETSNRDLSAELVREYVTRYIRYELGDREREAMNLYLRSAAELGLVDSIDVRFLEPAKVTSC